MDKLVVVHTRQNVADQTLIQGNWRTRIGITRKSPIRKIARFKTTIAGKQGKGQHLHGVILQVRKNNVSGKVSHQQIAGHGIERHRHGNPWSSSMSVPPDCDRPSHGAVM